MRRANPIEAVMQKSSTALLALSLASAAWVALAQGDLQVKDTAPDKYVVQKGDTLWSISTKFLKDQWRWPEIWRMNQEQIKNPHNISPGDVLVLDRSVSPPQLRLGDADAGTGTGAAPGAGASEKSSAGEPSGPGKLQPRVYTNSMAAQAIPAIPPRGIEPFLSQPLLIEEGG